MSSTVLLLSTENITQQKKISVSGLHYALESCMGTTFHPHPRHICPHPIPSLCMDFPTLVHSYNSLFTFIKNICIEPQCKFQYNMTIKKENSKFCSNTSNSYYSLPARRRPQGIVIIGVCLSVCLCVCAHCFCPQDISRTGSWITTKFGGWEQGVNL